LAHGGKLFNSSGFDFIITSDNAGTTPIAYERSIQNLTTGASELWVLIASLSSSVDTKIYLFYQNPSITTDQSNRTAVWDSHYKGVHHFTLLSSSDVYTTPVLDSTSNGNNLTPEGFNGQIIGGIGVMGAAAVWSGLALVDFVNASPTGMPTGASPRTLEIWVNTPQNGSFQSIYCIGSNAGNAIRYNLSLATTPSWQIEGDMQLTEFTGNTVGLHQVIATVPPGATTFGDTVPYVDGVLKVSAGNPTAMNTIIGDYRIGAVCSLGTQFTLAATGMVDEARISDIARSQDWITTGYNNQSNPNAFYSVGAQVPVDVSSGRTIIIN
jgi:hypothetical protein